MILALVLCPAVDTQRDWADPASCERQAEAVRSVEGHREDKGEPAADTEATGARVHKQAGTAARGNADTGAASKRGPPRREQRQRKGRLTNPEELKGDEN